MKPLQQIKPATLRVALIPIAFRPAQKSAGKPICEYILYPVPSSIGSDGVTGALMSAVNVWKSGLWVLSRSYRYLWDTLFMPSNYHPDSFYRFQQDADIKDTLKESKTRQWSWIDKVLRKPIFDFSDRLIWQWSTSPEEDFLREINTKAEFVHLKEKMEMPIKRVEIMVPKTLVRACILKSAFILPSSEYPRPLSDDDRSFDFTSSSEITPLFTKQLKHVTELGERFKSFEKKSKVVLATTIPFYLMWSYCLPDFDAILTNLWISGTVSTQLPMGTDPFNFFKRLEGLISLPLAYNIVKLLSYKRCATAASFLQRIVESEHSFKPRVEDDILKLEEQSRQSNDSNEKSLIQLNIDKLKQSLSEIGYQVVLIDESQDMLGKGIGISTNQHNSETSQQLPVFIDRREVYFNGKCYGIPPAQLYKRVTKAIGMLQMRDRLLNSDSYN